MIHPVFFMELIAYILKIHNAQLLIFYGKLLKFLKNKEKLEILFIFTEGATLIFFLNAFNFNLISYFQKVRSICTL